MSIKVFPVLPPIDHWEWVKRRIGQRGGDDLLKEIPRSVCHLARQKSTRQESVFWKYAVQWHNDTINPALLTARRMFFVSHTSSWVPTVCRGGFLVVVWPWWFTTLDDSLLSCTVWWFCVAFSVSLKTFDWTPAALLSTWIPKTGCFKKSNSKLVKSLDTGEMTESPTSRPTCQTSFSA